MLQQNQELELQIQARKESESAIFKSKEQYRLLVESAPDVIFTIANDSTLTSLSPAFETLLFWRPDEWIGNPFAGLIHPDDLPLLLDLFQQAMQGEAPPVFESRILTKQGNYLFFEFVIKLVRENGEIKGIMGITRHITERKKAEEKLKESEEKYRILAETSPEMIYLIDTKGYVSYVNKVAAAQFRAPAQELIGKQLKDIFPPDLAQQNLAGIQDVIATKSNFQSEVEMVFPTGNRWIDARLTPVFDDKNHVIGVLGLSYDITERKRAEESVAALSRRYQILLQMASDGIHVLDDQGHVVEVNEAFCTMLDYTREELLQLNVADWDMQWAGEELLAKVSELITHPFVFETRHRRKDGTFLDVEINVVSITLEGHKYTYSAARDITERKHTEAEIKKTNAELIKLNAEKDKFFSIIAHDLRSPFNSFLGLTQIMAEELPSLTMAQVQDLAISMEHSASNLYSLLENLLQWARMQQGLISFNPEEIQLHKIAAESITSMMEPAKNKGIDLVYDVPTDIKVVADSNMLQTVIRNLISNAVKFTPKGGKINLSAKSTGDESVEISIRDTGIGMNKVLLDKLFRLDEHTNRPGTEGEPSTGLGLLLCKEFIEKHGGQIWVESEVEKGSVFHFTIPCPPEPEEKIGTETVDLVDEQEKQIRT